MNEKKMNEPTLTNWKIAGVIATIAIILSVPLYIVRERLSAKELSSSGLQSEATFIGSTECASCHKAQYDKWEQSHHRRSMAPANEETVLGDFADSEFDHLGIKSRFFRKDGNYYVHTRGPGGNMADFQVTHTFGWYPLQQYLVPFPGGRLQCLPIAWDVEKKQWYHLYPDQQLPPEDWLYWTNQGQNWNGMCAECHSTDLKKNYDLAGDTFETSWSEISVGCEACHGPGSEHVKWAQLPEMGRPLMENAALKVQTRGLSSKQQIELCAPCHSRRSSLDDNIHNHDDFLDYGIPQLLGEGMYYADGQILEEVYVYGSFMQSKMYARDVRCSDCHDVHSIRRIKQGNDLCLQCHKATVYDSRDHHFHKQKGETGEPIRDQEGQILFDVGTGASCEQCHMPGRLYMGIDYRPDHSFRIPRPDLTQLIGTPNACGRCHSDKPIEWSMDAMVNWYGRTRRPHYGTILNQGRQQRPKVLSDLITLADDRLYSTIVRASALSLLAPYNDHQTRQAYKMALHDEEALMRHTAIRFLVEPDPRQRHQMLAPLLYDPVRAVRIEAARGLTSVPKESMNTDTRKKFESVLTEYRLTMERSADFPHARHNLGNLYSDLGQDETAVEHYRKAIEIDREFYPAKVNLAILYNRLRKNELAEKLLREVLEAHPDQHEVKYSLGLLLVEMKKPQEAIVYLIEAAKEMPWHSRIHYNLGILLQQMKRDEEAETSLMKALSIEPGNQEYLYAMAVFCLQHNRLDDAHLIAERLRQMPASRSIGQRLLKTIQQQRKTKMPAE